MLQRARDDWLFLHFQVTASNAKNPQKTDGGVAVFPKNAFRSRIPALSLSTVTEITNGRRRAKGLQACTPTMLTRTHVKAGAPTRTELSARVGAWVASIFDCQVAAEG